MDSFTATSNPRPPSRRIPRRPRSRTGGRRAFLGSVALRDAFGLEPPPRPRWRSGVSSTQFGPLAEDLLAVTLTAAARGLATVARPSLDRGIDLYLRRLRSLLTLPIQVKAFHTLDPDGNGVLEVAAEDIDSH